MNEILIVTKYVNHRGLIAAALVFSVLSPFLLLPKGHLPSIIALLVYILVLAVLQIAYHETLMIERTGFVFFVSILVPISFSCLAYLRAFSLRDGLFYVFLGLVMPWTCDIGAYFTGTFLGKHKLCPKISPKKTIEGLVGGFIISIASSVLLAWLYQILFLKETATINLWMVGVLALICAPLSVMGDLLASIIKRQCQVKDFGNIMPGHGGVMDRFDSLMFVTPVLFVAVLYFPFIH